jgi:hypothetical protein
MEIKMTDVHKYAVGVMRVEDYAFVKAEIDVQTDQGRRARPLARLVASEAEV